MSDPLSDKEIRLACIELAVRVQERLGLNQSLLQTMRIFSDFIDGECDADIIRAANEIEALAKIPPSPSSS